MKRSSMIALIVGAAVSVFVIALYALHVTLPLERAVMAAVLHGAAPSKTFSVKAQYVLIVLLSLGAAWLVANSQRREKLILPVAIFAIELFVIAWVALLFQTYFEPIPSVLSVALSFAATSGYFAFAGRSKSSLANELFRGRVSDARLAEIAAGEVTYDPEPRGYDITAVVCDIANKHDLVDDCPPDLIAQITDKFIQHATESFVNAGAYIDTITGEGIVALFGFPGTDAEQAEKATRHALALIDSFEKMRDGNDGVFSKFGVHVGISSGTMIFSPLQQDERRSLLATGEPVELARRFCIANRFYGSRVLIGPGTFELASKNIVARPIDFLSGVDVRERHEIYEPLMLASEATPDELARRDYFWNGVVLYREKRWGEAYTQFQRARGPNEEEDAPLQLYLRRLEPLALHLVEVE
ncbi:MAG TPA: adenylate/guanylate cyclase domain-containing protein [Chthoniobacterales bacterium]